MKHILSILLFSVLYLSAYGQGIPPYLYDHVPVTDFEHFKDCKFYQFTESDSLDRYLAKSQKIDSKGQIVGQNTTNFRTGIHSRKGNGKVAYIYGNAGLKQEQYFYENSDRIDRGVIIHRSYHYNEHNNLIRMDMYDYRRRLKPSEVGYHIILEEDFEKEPTWKKTGEMFYYYDDNNRLVEKYAPKIFTSSQNRYTYKYDQDGRLIEKSSYEHDRLIWIENYTYSNDGYLHDRIWYKEGNPDSERPTYIYKFKEDKKGNLIEKQIIRNDSLTNRTLFFYDHNGEVEREVIMDSENNPKLTTIRSCH